MLIASVILGVAMAAAAPSAPAVPATPAVSPTPGSGAVSTATAGDRYAPDSIGFWEGSLLGLVQGVTEFLPVSSSGHLAIGHWLTEKEGSEAQRPALEAQRVAFDVAMHLATLLAMLIYFRNDIMSLLTTRRRLLGWIVLGSVPAASIGLIFKHTVESLGGFPLFVAGAFVVNGLLLAASNYFGVEMKKLGEMKAGDSLLIGLAQAVAITPGISRSGSTISAGLMCGMRREEAFTFSFLLGMPAIAGAAFLEAGKISAVAFSTSWGGLAAGFVVAFASGLASIWILSRLVKRRNLLPFGLYTIGLALVVFVLWMFR